MVANMKAPKKGVRPEFPREPRKFFYEEADSALTTDVDGINSAVGIWGQP